MIYRSRANRNGVKDNCNLLEILLDKDSNKKRKDTEKIHQDAGSCSWKEEKKQKYYLAEDGKWEILSYLPLRLRGRFNYNNHSITPGFPVPRWVHRDLFHGED